MAILLLVSWPQLQLVVIGRAHSLGIARPNLLFSQFLSDSLSRLALPQGEAPTANVDIYPKKIYEYRG